MELLTNRLEFDNPRLTPEDALFQIADATGLDDETVRTQIPGFADSGVVQCCFYRHYKGEVWLLGADGDNKQRFVVAIVISPDGVTFPSRESDAQRQRDSDQFLL